MPEDIQLWDPAVQKAWDRCPGETETAYEAFIKYLQLPKRSLGGNAPRRVVADLSLDGSKRKQTYHEWYKLWAWEERAAEYDAWEQMPEDIAILAAKRHLAEKMHETSDLLFQLARKAIKKAIRENHTLSLDDGLKIAKLAAALGGNAVKLEQPIADDAEARLNDEIEQLIAGGGLALLTPGSEASSSEATQGSSIGEFEDEIELGRGSVSEIQGLPGEICFRDP